MDQADNMKHLDRAIEIAERIGDDTGLAYARTWQVWGHFVAGRPREAIEAAKSIEAWVIANRESDPYPYFKSQCTMVFALTFSGQFADVERICADVIEFGHKVGNNRCIAFGNQALAMMHFGLGNFARAVALAEEASATAKDPMYRDTSKLTTILAASFSGDLDTARAGVDHLRTVVGAGVQLPSPLFVDVADALVRIGDGELSNGMSLLERTIETAGGASRVWEWLTGRSVKAVVMARIASGETTGDLKALLRNPRFISYVRKARSGAAAELTVVRDDARAMAYEVNANICDLELAKLFLSQGHDVEARVLLERSLAFFDRTAETEGAERVRELLARV
jgi:hypothetical protein